MNYCFSIPHLWWGKVVGWGRLGHRSTTDWSYSKPPLAEPSENTLSKLTELSGALRDRQNTFQRFLNNVLGTRAFCESYKLFCQEKEAEEEEEGGENRGGGEKLGRGVLPMLKQTWEAVFFLPVELLYMVNLQERKKSTQHAPVYVTKNFLLKIPNIINLCTLGTALLDYLFLGLGTVSSSTVPSSSNSLSAFFFFLLVWSLSWFLLWLRTVIHPQCLLEYLPKRR